MVFSFRSRGAREATTSSLTFATAKRIQRSWWIGWSAMLWEFCDLPSGVKKLPGRVSTPHWAASIWLISDEVYRPPAYSGNSTYA